MTPGTCAVRYYDAEAPVYDRRRWTHARGRARHEWQEKTLLGLFGDVRGRILLEIGCGTGRLTECAALQCAGLIAVDASLGMLCQARNRLRCEADPVPFLVAADGTRLPLARGSVDIIYMVNVLQLMENPGLLFQEAARVLGAGGRMLFNHPHLGSLYLPYGLFRNVTGRARNRNRAGYRPTRWFSHREIRRLLGGAGFTVMTRVGQPGMAPRNPRAARHPFFSPSVFVSAQKGIS